MAQPFVRVMSSSHQRRCAFGKRVGRTSDSGLMDEAGGDKRDQAAELCPGEHPSARLGNWNASMIARPPRSCAPETTNCSWLLLTIQRQAKEPAARMLRLSDGVLPRVVTGSIGGSGYPHLDRVH